MKFHQPLLAGSLLALLWVCGGLSNIAAAQSAAASVPTVHDHAAEAAAIRTNRLKRLEDRVTVAPEVLSQACRYESDITTRPPHKRVVLSFDDGPEPGQTPYILALLQKYHVPGAFFMIGEKAQKHPELVQAVKEPLQKSVR